LTANLHRATKAGTRRRGDDLHPEGAERLRAKDNVIYRSDRGGLQCRSRVAAVLTNAAMVGAAGLGGFGAWGKALAAEPPPEVTTIRFEKDDGTCIAPQVFQELLRAEGFTDIRYVDLTEAHLRRANAANLSPNSDMIVHGEVDFAREFAANLLLTMNAGGPVTVLSGLHLGCFEIFGKNEIRTLGDLKGRTVGAEIYTDKSLLTIMTALVGLDPAKDLRWVTDPRPMDLFVEGKIDAFLAAPPVLQEVRAKNIGHVIVSSIADRPWSEYYCCMLAAGTEFVRNYPVATKRVLRAILKASDLCVSEPDRVAKLLVEQGYTKRYDYALQALSDIRYDVWRDYDPEDTLRFYALRLHEAGLIKDTPEKLIAEHTDWRFLDEIKRELKA
jgi:NitT/TauT family transport system substrate-binding protein